MDEYVNDKNNFSICEKNIILSQFKNKEDYRNFATSSLGEILRKREEEEISKMIESGVKDYTEAKKASAEVLDGK